MSYVFVKDNEGFMCKKQKKCVEQNEKIISKEEYKMLSGDDYYDDNFSNPLSYQIHVTKQEKDFISFARKHNFDYKQAMR